MMTKTIEQEALDLINEVRAEYCHRAHTMPQAVVQYGMAITALSRALEAHDATLAEFEAFRRKVSDKAEVVKKLHPTAACYLGDLILPKPVDPLVEAVRDCGYATLDAIEPEFVADLRTALAKRGLKLVEQSAQATARAALEEQSKGQIDDDIKDAYRRGRYDGRVQGHISEGRWWCFGVLCGVVLSVLVWSFWP